MEGFGYAGRPRSAERRWLGVKCRLPRGKRVWHIGGGCARASTSAAFGMCGDRNTQRRSDALGRSAELAARTAARSGAALRVRRRAARAGALAGCRRCRGAARSPLARRACAST